MSVMRTGPGLALLVAFLGGPVSAEETRTELTVASIPSTRDGQPQSALYWAPSGAKEKPTPLLVFLHSWSSTYQQDCSPWWKEASTRNWLYLQPDFRGANTRPQACGSPLARQDVLDAIDWISDQYKVDPSRIYLAGASGGGHMAMLMASRHPERFSGVSAWVGISDLAEWHRFHTRGGKPGRYAENVVACCGGLPGDSKAVTAEYIDRSPIHWLQNTGDLPLDLAAGVHDGKTGSVPIAHTLRAFNIVAKVRGADAVSEDEMTQLQEHSRLEVPRKEDQQVDPTYDRALHLRRHAGTARVTIFEGGHEGLAAPGCAWLEKQTRMTSATGRGATLQETPEAR
ncbi:Prolyl oligopeptidase family protein [Caulifigura coniformis]|uniref:Prolyl oligopeptidase family protein n=1 Tax=Caulifigura coniformis TaxID=2527983 RepID=A0A517SIP7_9PLAN|nr:prolyl oligopeptidase family serine peptidase [Caulifigura coniformis]QDT55997.1 Prolyl oligopeptidase family protein [Caulifigura coniformis]